jgi:hypothetical protein
MLAKISASINVAGLVDALKVSPTRALNLKHKIYYFLSLITDTNVNYRLNGDKGGYHNLCSTQLKQILGNKDFYKIRKILLKPYDPIIEVDRSWQNAKGSNSRGYCQGYRITPKYNTGEVIYKTLPKKLEKRILKTHKTENTNGLIPNYQFLLNQFECNTLSFDRLVYNYMYHFGKMLLQKIQDNNPYLKNLVYNLIGRWLYYIKQISDRKLWYKVSDKNHRLNSSVTNLPKLLRPFLLCSGEPLSCVDISSSQPYILSSVMQTRFYQEEIEGYNLKKIYPELYQELVEIGNIDTSITYSSCNNNQYYNSHTGYTTNTYSNSLCNSYSFMWCDLFTTTELDSINIYTQSPFYMDFYTHVLDRYYTYTNTPVKAVNMDDREKIKNTMMYVLFDNNQNHRSNNQQIQIFQTVFPGVEKWINQIHKLIGKQRFSYLLQRTESYLLLGVICREFNSMFPDAPLFTIHDGVFTTEEYVKKLNGFVLKRLKELTGVLAGSKIKVSQIDPNPQKRDVENEWDKIKSIDNEEKYNKNCNGVFSSNIKRGSGFMENFGANFFNSIDDII